MLTLFVQQYGSLLCKEAKQLTAFQPRTRLGKQIAMYWSDTSVYVAADTACTRHAHVHCGEGLIEGRAERECCTAQDCADLFKPLTEAAGL